jgi:hypothetical protein
MFEIEIKVENEEDLYNPFDNRNRTLSDDFVNYIITCLKDRSFKEETRLVIMGNKIDTKKLETAMQSAYESKRRLLKIERRAYQFKCLRLLFIGILFVVIGIAFAGKMNEVVGAIVSTIGSFSIWEAANIWIEELPELRLKRRLIETFESFEVITKQK